LARIRTIKPDFFTSEDIVALSPHARLLYIALWCEADREGRFGWRPGTFKLRYFPGDSIDVEAIGNELIERGLVVLYGEGLAHIPTFADHQHVNPREAQSTLPRPARVPTREDASNLDTHTQVGREGKGRRETRERSHGSRLPSSWEPPEILKAWASKERPDLDLAQTLAKFRDYWAAKPGKAGTKLDWDATFRNWVRDEKPGRRVAVSAGEVI
jgi:hypothetical protein